MIPLQDLPAVLESEPEAVTSGALLSAYPNYHLGTVFSGFSLDLAAAVVAIAAGGVAANSR